MKTLKLLKLILIAAFIAPTLVLANAGEDDVVGYDSIIEELSSSRTSAESYRPQEDPLANVMIHGGAGYATSYINLNPEKGEKISGLLKGFEATFGIDLFSRDWIAEGAVRSYQSEELDRETQISMKEFDLKVVHRSELARALSARVGGGLAARYLTVERRVSEEILKPQYTTPSSLIFVGFQAHISPRISLGSDLSYRNSLIDDSIDQSSLDASLRLDAHF